MQFKKLLFTAMIATNASGIDHGRVFINGKKKFLFFSVGITLLEI